MWIGLAVGLVLGFIMGVTALQLSWAEKQNELLRDIAKQAEELLRANKANVVYLGEMRDVVAAFKGRKVH